MTDKTVPLKRVASVRISNVDKKTAEGDLEVRLCNYTDVYYRDTIRPAQEFMGATATVEQVADFHLQPGDVIIIKDSETPDDIGVPAFVESSAQDLVCGYHLAIIRPDPVRLDGRFLYWTMASTTTRRRLAVAATGVTRFGLRSESIASLPIPLPPRQQQRAIADCLDAETARIDGLIAKKRQLHAAVWSRWLALLQARIEPATSGETAPSLRRLVESAVGGSWGEERGSAEVDALCVRGTDFDMRSLEVNTASAPVRSYTAGEFERRRLLPGDLIIEKSGGSEAQPVGRVVQWLGDERAVPTNFAARVRPRAATDSRFLTYLRNSAYVRGMTRAWTKQTTGIQNLDLGGLLSDRWALAGVQEQRRLAARLDCDLARARAVQQSLREQVGLLQERRQALISAAVIGELKISEAIRSAPEHEPEVLGIS